MVTEYIKRNQRMGFNENGDLVYKVPLTEEAPELTTPPTTPEEEVVADNTPAATEDY